MVVPLSKYPVNNVSLVVRLWMDAISTPAMLAIMGCEFANSWGLYTLLTEGPTFLKDILNFDITEVIFAC